MEILYAMANQSAKKDSMARITTLDSEQKTDEYMSESTSIIKVARELVATERSAAIGYI